MRNGLDVYRGSLGPVLSVMSEFDEMFNRAFKNPLAMRSEQRAMDREWFLPDVDLEETDQAYLLSVDLPGVKKDDVNVDLKDNVLTVSGERRREERGGRFYGRFQRSFTVPSTIDSAKVEASLEDGVLTIALPKAETAKPRSIQVQSGRPSGFFSKFLGKGTEDDKESKEH